MYIPLKLEEFREFAEKQKTFIVLDSASTDIAGRFSYIFANPIKVISARKFEDVEGLFDAIDSYSGKYWLCGYLSYEASYVFEDKFSGFCTDLARGRLPLAWFGVFERPYIFDHGDGLWDRTPAFQTKTLSLNKSIEASLIKLSLGINFSTYKRKLHSIKKCISAGETYQVNFSFDLSADFRGDPFSIYLKLRRNQPAGYCAYLQNESGRVLSFSPELFFSMSGRNIITRPMKGTAPRNAWPKKDIELIKELKTSKKDKAENIMIVDLLRNDLSRVCKTGSVKVQKLFKVESYPTVHQMTSTVKGKLRDDVKLTDVIRSLFPSGSVTGAPKIRTMEIIRSLEYGQRGVYCGMLGFSSPKGKAIFSVPIRILQKARNQKKWRYRVGSGVVWNSSERGEWRECMEKCRFLNSSQNISFEIFESMLWNGRLIYLKDHLSRLKKSAAALGFCIDRFELDKVVAEICCTLAGKRGIKVRIFLTRVGELRWDYETMENTGNSKPLLAKIKRIPAYEKNIFIYHKTTYRPWYEKALKEISSGRYFDFIFINSRRELTEGARSNIFVRKGSVLYTPPLRCGLLAGVLRKQLLKRKICKEKVLFEEDLRNADAIYCGNSVRGLNEVKISVK